MIFKRMVGAGIFFLVTFTPSFIHFVREGGGVRPKNNKNCTLASFKITSKDSQVTLKYEVFSRTFLHVLHLVVSMYVIWQFVLLPSEIGGMDFMVGFICL